MWHDCLCVCVCVCVCVCDTFVHSFGCAVSSKMMNVSNTWFRILQSSLKNFYSDRPFGYDLEGLCSAL
jgi:hypothetical protein